MVDSREKELDFIVKVADVTIFCKIRENMNGRMMKKVRSSEKVVILTEEVLVLTKEEVILILEVDFVVIVSDVVNRDIDLLNVDLLKVGKVTKIM